MRSVAVNQGGGKRVTSAVTREEIEAEIAQMVHEALDELFRRSAAEEFDLDAIEVAVQQKLRPMGGRMVEGVLVERVRNSEANPPGCVQCGRRMERELRQRNLVGLVGEYRLNRGYYRCRRCGTHCIPTDTVLGIGPGALSPALSRIAATGAARVAFGAAASSINEALGTHLTEAEVYRTAEALGAVAEAETSAAATTNTPTPPATPASDTLLIGADGTTSFTDGGWHEVKVGVVAALGPGRRTDPKTGRTYLTVGEKAYCALVGSADDFFPRLHALARDAGLGHSSLRTLVTIGDGSPWIWKRMAGLHCPGVRRVEVLDYVHATQHVWDLAKELFAPLSLDANAWAAPLCDSLKEQGSAPLFAALKRLDPPSAAARAAVTNTIDYLAVHADAGRMDYPAFAAAGLPIASGIVEAGCNSVVCQRAKGAGKRWRRLGAQTILSLRCLRLSPARWADFFRRRPGPLRPPVATLRQESA